MMVRHADGRKEQRTEEIVKPANVADADIAQRVAVIGALQCQEARLLGPGRPALPPVLKRHLQGDFDGRGAVVGEEDTRQAGGASSTSFRAS